MTDTLQAESWKRFARIAFYIHAIAIIGVGTSCHYLWSITLSIITLGSFLQSLALVL
ncbi:MAG: hypothetical protein R2822_22480 [Spirosomataceae bacterium]